MVAWCVLRNLHQKETPDHPTSREIKPKWKIISTLGGGVCVSPDYKFITIITSNF